MESMKKDADLFYLLYANQNVDVAQRERSRHYQFTKADELAQKIRENPNEQLMIELIDRADLIHVDMVLACLLADGKIKTFSAKLAM
jgi:phosphoglycerate-specific signal transduction histidine kinase